MKAVLAKDVHQKPVLSTGRCGRTCTACTCSVYQLSILTTNQCTAACDHCLMECSPLRRGKLSFSTIHKTVSELLENHHPLSVVIFTGGEPTLLRSDLLDAIAFCEEKGLITRIVTNASWANTTKRASNTIETLREAGLSEINFSTDDYHVPYVKFDNIVNAWNASKNQGFKSVVIANCTGPKSNITSKFIRSQLGEDIAEIWDENGEARDITSSREGGTVYLTSNALLQRLGKGRNFSDEEIFFPKNQRMLNLPCRMAISSTSLSVDGHMLACCGFKAQNNKYLDFGDAKTSNASDLVVKGSDSLIIRALMRYGPYSLMNCISMMSKVPIFKHRYVSACEICQDILTHPVSQKIIDTHLPELFPFLEHQ